MGGGEKDATSGENSLSRGDPSGPWNWGSDWPCCPLVATACRLCLLLTGLGPMERAWRGSSERCRAQHCHRPCCRACC